MDLVFTVTGKEGSGPPGVSRMAPHQPPQGGNVAGSNAQQAKHERIVVVHVLTQNLQAIDGPMRTGLIVHLVVCSLVV